LNLQTYQEQRTQQQQLDPKWRELCLRCFQPQFSCYCEHLKPFNPNIEFVILIHPIEFKRRIATGRMSHLTLVGSHLLVGQDFSKCTKVSELIGDGTKQCFILYPSKEASDLSVLSSSQKDELFASEKKTVIFVIDGTWHTARKTMRQTDSFSKLPKICFTPRSPSNFRVRKQPKPHCYSTVEAIHEVIDLMGNAVDFDVSTRLHDGLLFTFEKIVERQLNVMSQHPSSLRRSRKRQYRREKTG
jgi:DTW domain-containing protein